MKGIIVNFRRGRTIQHENQVILKVEGVSDKEAAAKLVGKEVKYLCVGKNKKEIVGKISSAHGNKGAVRVLFERGIPGQALGTELNF